MVSGRGWLYVSSGLASACFWSGIALSRPRLIEAGILFFALMCATIVAMLNAKSGITQRDPMAVPDDHHNDDQSHRAVGD